METTDPRPLHLDITAAGGALLMAIATLLAALGHPLSASLHEGIMALIGAVALVASIIVGRVQAHRSRKEMAAIKAGTEKAMEVLSVLKGFEPLDHDGKPTEGFARAVEDALAEGRVTAPREPVPEEAD